MTVHWNPHRGFSGELKTASSAKEEPLAEPDGDVASLAEWILAMRKIPPARTAHVRRAKKLIADPSYPSRELLKGVAGVLSQHLRSATE